MLSTISARLFFRDRQYAFVSAFLVTVAFWYPASLGFLILFSWFPLFMIFRPTFRLGFCWGLITFSCHFVWLFAVLKNKTAAPEWCAALLYLGIVVYFSLTAGVWFGFYGLFVRWLTTPVRHVRLMDGWRRLFVWWGCALGYYWFLSNCSLFVLGRLEGYPFLNPALALARYPWFLWVVGQVGLVIQCFLGLHPVTARSVVTHIPPIEFIYCPPVSVSTMVQTPVGLGQAVYHRLTNLNLSPHNGKTVRVVVAPETFYQASLNVHDEQTKLWMAALPDDVHMIIGSQATLPTHSTTPQSGSAQGERNFSATVRGEPVEPPPFGRRGADVMPPKYYQTAYWLHQGLIKKYYVKKHRVLFAEKIPKVWQKIAGIKTLFLKDNLQFSRDHRPLTDGLWELSPRVVILPQLCSELFFTTDAHEIWRAAYGCGGGANFFIVFLVNDSWFVKYFKNILQDLTAIKAAYLRVPIVYVGHEELKIYGN